jgi:hypothetical protein
MTHKEAGQRIRALANDAAEQLHEPGGVPVRRTFETTAGAAKIIVDFVIGRLPDLETSINAVQPALLADASKGVPASDTTRLASIILDALAELVEEHFAAYIDQVPPASEDFDTLADVKRRAAIALYTSIEADANKPDGAPGHLHDLAKSFRDVSESFAHGRNFGGASDTTLEAPELNHLAALEHFYDCVRFDAGLPARVGTISYEDARHCLDACRGKYNAINAELLSANLELGDLRSFATGVKELVGYHDDSTMNATFNLQASLGVLKEFRTDARLVRDSLSVRLENINAHVGRAAAQISTMVLESDLAAARKALPNETYLPIIEAHAQRYAAIRELSTLASSVPKLRAELQAANDEVAGLHERVACYRSMNHNFDTIITTEHAKLGIPQRVRLPEDETEIIEFGCRALDAAERVQYGTRIALVRQMAELGVHDRTIVKEARTALADRGFGNDELTVDRIHRMADALSKACADRTSAESFLVVARRQLDDIRDLLAKNGFVSDNLLGVVETALESLTEAQKERDVADTQLDKIATETIELVATLQQLGEKFCGRTFVVDNHGSRMNVLRRIVEADNEVRRSVAAKTAQLVEKHAECQAEINSIGALLQGAIKWTSHEFEVNSHGRRMDVIRDLATRAESIRHVEEALAECKVVKGHPAQAIRILATDLAAVQDEIAVVTEALGLAGKTADLPADAAKIVQDRDSLRATILAIQDALAAMPVDLSRPPNSGSKGDIIDAVASLIADRDALEGALGHVTRCHQEAIAALSKRRKKGTLAEPFNLSALMGALVGLSDFWRRSSDTLWIAAAAGLEKALKDTLGESYWLLLADVRRAVKGTNEIGAIVAVATHDAQKGDFVNATMGHVSSGFPMNEGHETSRAAIDDAARRKSMPNIFDCGCSKHKVTAGRCNVYNEFGALRPSEAPAPVEATQLQPPVFGKGSF